MENYNNDFAEKFRARTKHFVLEVIKLYRLLPRSVEAQIIGKQWLRCSTSVGANYRAACRARSQNEFSSKLSIVIEEVDESLFWMELLIESQIMEKEKLIIVMNEATEILKVVSTARKSISEKKNLLIH
ncbi:four helix bundle protein [Mucilaginibacter sp. KACC 22063]|uniref:four helix bundle protein n=1 Tax=Mucilaginibacter sp. KACC 22063 TaxID=3025666 RepID=UPI0023658994|nr:four helix bundle protein [Mucilaginibacter sp. KACC 22063]WDF56971.1 four helix bundle protein [Mucilaginibacter sp. KACC 22063]